MPRVPVPFSPVPPTYAARVLAWAAACLFGAASTGQAQRPPGAQPVPGIKSPVSLPSYSVEVYSLAPSSACRPTVGRPMTVIMVLRNTGTTVAPNVPWQLSMFDSRNGVNTIIGAGTRPAIAPGGLDTVTAVATTSAPSVAVHGTVAPNGPVRANTAPIARQAMDRTITLYGVSIPRTVGGGGGGASGPTGIVGGNLPPCP